MPKATGTFAPVPAFREGVPLQTFASDCDAQHVDLGALLAGMRPADRIGIEGIAPRGGVVSPVPRDRLGIRHAAAAGQDLLRVASPAPAAGGLPASRRPAMQRASAGGSRPWP